jgi:hypothetical protein
MKSLIFGLLLVFAVQVNARPKSMAEALEGKWIGFCSPQALSNTGKICHYTFQKDSGTYQCEYFKDLRCNKKDDKVTTVAFHYTIQGSNEQNLKLNIEFADRPDIRQEKSRAYITGSVLRLQVYEVFRLPDVKEENLDAQGVLPFFEFTKAK